jgi:protein ImuA
MTVAASFGQQALLAVLRARVAQLEGANWARHGDEPIPVCDGLALPSGGLARAALHEVLAGVPGCGAAFAAVLLAHSGGTVLWISGVGDPLLAWPPGLARCGLDPAQLIYVQAERSVDALWAMEEALRCPAISGALLALGGEKEPATLDLTATRRLQLAAEAGGALGLLLRPDAGESLGPSAAATRWRVSPLTGDELSANWQRELLRARGGSPGEPWAVTWHETEGLLTLGEEAVATAARPGRLSRR